LTGGEETRVLSIYTFITTNPSAISLAKAHTPVPVTSLALSGAMHSVIGNMQVFFLLCVFLIKHLDEITNGRFGRH
jgi:hypothetical protein